MIRKARAADAGFIYQTLAETQTPWGEIGVRCSIECDTVFICEGAGVIIARIAADECEILNFAVLKEKRRQGTGGELIEMLINEAKQAGAKSIYLDVRKSNAAAISLYREKGFEINGERKDFYQEPREDAVLMRRAV